MSVSYSHNYGEYDIMVNTIDWSQSWAPTDRLKGISIYSNQNVLVRFNDNTDPNGDRTHIIRGGQTKSFNLTVITVYFAKAAAGDPDATVDVDGVA